MMRDNPDAKAVELMVDSENKLWLNVDGVCVVRIGHVEHVTIDVANGATPGSIELRGILADLAAANDYLGARA